MGLEVLYILWIERIEKRHISPKRSESPVSWNHERAYATPRTPQAEENAAKNCDFFRHSNRKKRRTLGRRGAEAHTGAGGREPWRPLPPGHEVLGAMVKYRSLPATRKNFPTENSTQALQEDTP